RSHTAMPQENSYSGSTTTKRVDRPADGNRTNSGTEDGAMKGVQERAAQVGEKITEQADAGLDRAAESLGDASDQIRQKAREQGGVQEQIGTKVADGLDKTSEYLESRDTAQIIDDVEAYVKEHPMEALAGAVRGGFRLARVLR